VVTAALPVALTTTWGIYRHRDDRFRPGFNAEKLDLQVHR